jgi:hypothetical protein
MMMDDLDDEDDPSAADWLSHLSPVVSQSNVFQSANEAGSDDKKVIYAAIHKY